MTAKLPPTPWTSERINGSRRAPPASGLVACTGRHASGSPAGTSPHRRALGGAPEQLVCLPSDASVHLLAMLRPTWLPPPPERDGRPLLSPGLVPWRARCLRPANSQVRQLPPVLRAPSGPRAERLDPELRSSVDTPLLVPRDVVNPTAMPAKRAVQAGSHHQRPSSQTPRPQGWLPA